MNVLDLAEALNLYPKKTASTNGGEYKSKCPKCQEGIDRFCIWPNQGKTGRYWCRVCEAHGDGIQFCRDFLGMSFQKACQRLNLTPSASNMPLIKRKAFVPNIPIPVTDLWKQAAKKFIASSHNRLMNQPEVIEYLSNRGFTFDTIQRFSFGWNPVNLFDQRERWGLPQEINENGFPKGQWLPKGIAIPFFRGSEPIKLKIRRSDWFSEDKFPKYVEVPGSSQSPSIYGNRSKPPIIVESELDAILIQQEASELVCSVALGGVSRKPDVELHELLKRAPLVLLSLDFDVAGKKHYSFWMKQYPTLHPWPAPFVKSPGDALEKSHINMRDWINCGLSSYGL